MNVRLNVTWLLAIAAGIGMYGLSFAQEGQPPSTAEQPADDLPNSSLAAPSVENYSPNVNTTTWMLGNPVPVRANLVPSIRAAAEAVRDAEGPTAKADAQAKLTDYLAKYFDDDMVRRQKALEQVEQRVAKLRELLDRRRNHKREIIELQAKVALNEAEGLGFYQGENSANPLSSGPTTFGDDLAPPTADPAAMRTF